MIYMKHWHNSIPHILIVSHELFDYFSFRPDFQLKVTDFSVQLQELFLL